MHDRQSKALDGVGRSVDGYTQKESQVSSASGAMSGAMDKVSDAANGTSDSITDLNGNPIDIKDNGDEASANLNGVTDSVKSIPDEKNVFVNVIRNFFDRITGSNGAFYNGLDYVPFDGFTATLHKGERVLTAEENKRYAATGGGASIDYDRMERMMVRAVSQLNIKYNEREVARIVREVV